jgi:hypothetical protein
MQGSQGIATYRGASGGTTTVPVLDWMSPPPQITVNGEVRTLAVCIHDAPPDALVREQTARVRAERQEQHEAAGRRRAFNVRLYGGLS